MLLSELLESAAVRSGIQKDDQSLIALLGNPALSAIEVDNTIAESVNRNLMDLNAAKANPAVKAHFTSAALSTVDQKVAELVSEYGLPEDILSDKSTYNKLDLVKNAIKEKLAAAGKKTDSPEAKQQIEALQAQLNSLKTEKETEVQAVKQAWEADKLNSAITSQFSAYSWNDAIPDALRSPAVIKSLLDAELASSKAKIKTVEGQLQLVNAEDESLPFYQDNKPVDFKGFTDAFMAKNNFIKTVADQGQAKQFQTNVDPKGQAKMPKYQQSVIAANEKALREQGITI